MNIETTALYQEMRRRAPDIPAGPSQLVNEFERLRAILQEHGKYIVLLFPEYTPHDHTRHLGNLFALADRVLGTPLYTRLGPTELVLLVFGLYAHDWGMAVSEAERQALVTATPTHSFTFLPDEPSGAKAFISEASLAGVSTEVAWRDYVRHTHGLRSGARLRKHLEPFGSVFADAVAKIAEGHTLAIREVRDPDRYPLNLSVFGETVNLAALATYVRIIDLLDIGEDRTPYALWKFVAPADPISATEWQKHRALSPVSVKNGPALREVLVSGRTEDPAVFAALADLRSWIDSQFAMSIAQLRTISGRYDVDLDSRILWSIDVSGFEPLTVRFELDRSEMLGLLSDELYKDDPLAFLRELLQNSVDAIDIREALLAKHGLELKGEIQIRINSNAFGLCVEWSDNGIGMDEDVLSSYFARLGRSWYRSREASHVAQIEAISQFGIGVLSCFAVSHKLRVETRKDPLAGSARPGLVVEIPARESHFRIRTVAGLPVGTTIRLKVSPRFMTLLSKESICTALARISRYVRHRIIVDCDGARTECGLGTDSSSDSGIALVRMRGHSAEKLSKASTAVVFEVGDPASDFHGHYSAIVPKWPGKVRSDTDFSVWIMADERIEFDDILNTSEQAVFVKGVQIGPVMNLPHRQAGGPPSLTGARYTSWISPRLLLNVRRPSYLQFNLDRSSVHFKSDRRPEAVWREIASKLRAVAFNWPLATAADTAMLLGACAVFGGVPDVGLDTLVELGESPVPVLRSGKGVVWESLKEFVRGDEFIEAPFELTYACRDKFPLFERSSGLQGWEGDEALFLLGDGVDSHCYPWLDNVLGFSRRVLARLGWHPAELRIVQAPANETLPLACRVWRNFGIDHHDVDPSKEGIGGERRRAMTLKHLYGEAPEALRFPLSMAEYAALGSRYWNIDHPKIAQIIAALTALSDRLRQHRLSADSSRLVSYLTSNTFYGYVIPSRISDITLALETPNRLLDVAEKEGIAQAEHLVPSDFVPGTITGYQNPYSYDLRKWKVQKTGLGQPLAGGWPTWPSPKPLQG